MFKKTLLAASALAAIAVPGVASARPHYSQLYYGSQYGNYGGYGTYGRGYAPSYNYGYGNGYYGNGYYNNGYASQGYYGNTYYDGRNGYRCGNGTAGTVIGGVAGAVIGSQVTRGGGYNRYGYRRGGSGTTGAIVGGAIGALLGNQVAKGSC
ncbi:glycine zipper 2TM domain-containing protein [Sphingomonas sp. BN140010]|uniref:Glycine zipper 2TM domain-containing protein n=1 Tax=Sphingomonas arvum TaxID=2992113 RepID=A0ABT3JHX2_9SPHN|nr:glycine zipper 2TM domain-containing protein [Sphingomonas sp. BN140010]MCW3798586.1 glycine zipper 2TM domain-containing protein [Sphingomonas sp. BN140010]